MIPPFGPIHAVSISNSLYSSFQFLSCFPFSSASTSPSVIIVCLPLLGDIFNEQHWNLFDIVFVVAKLGNRCFESNIYVREAKMFLTSGKNNFCFRNMFPARLNWETFASATINVFATMFLSLARLRGTKNLFCECGLKYFSPLRGTNSKTSNQLRHNF